MPGNLNVIVQVARFALELLAGTGGGYFALLTGATFVGRSKASSSDPTDLRFAVVVPAHNEEQVISRTLKSLEQLDYPAERYEIFVVADNCVDATAEVAQGFRCTVWERVDPYRRSKGYALRWAFEQIPRKYDAIVVVDADSEADPGLLAQFSRNYDPSAALQGLYLQRFDSSTFSVASYVASALHNGLKPWGRENLGCSAGLGGNGMCLPRIVLEEVPWQRFGLAEDFEYHLDLVLAGKRVRFVPEARVEAIAPSSLRGMYSQRLRWERGRVDTLQCFAGPLLGRVLRGGGKTSLEAFISMVAPPFSLTVSSAVGCAALGLVRRSKGDMVVGALGLAASMGATLRALWLIQAPAKVYLYLPALPLFVCWRIYITLRSVLGGAGQDWVRTERSGG
jgi:1,2-diacylglycerol 3-beta-glucosyltransferase